MRIVFSGNRPDPAFGILGYETGLRPEAGLSTTGESSAVRGVLGGGLVGEVDSKEVMDPTDLWVS